MSEAILNVWHCWIDCHAHASYLRWNGQPGVIMYLLVKAVYYHVHICTRARPHIQSPSHYYGCVLS